jgi:hypothetical protein
MSFIKNLLKPKPQQEYGPRAEDYAHSIVAGQGPSSAGEEQARQDLGINIHTLVDEKIYKMIEALTVVGSQFTIRDPVTGEDKLFTVNYPRQWAMVLQVIVSKVNACHFLTKEEAITNKIKLRNEVDKMKLTMTNTDIDMFGSLINIVIIMIGEPSISDSIDGQKMLSLKVQSREYKVGLSTK